MELSEIQEFRTTKLQKKTLRTLRKKYRLNTSDFIRKAINEKLERDKDGIFKHYAEVQNYIKQQDECCF